MPHKAPIHSPIRMRADPRPVTSTDRGYDADWRTLRDMYLAEHPLCECDDCDAGRKRLTRADVVNHRQEIRDRPDLRLDWTNLQAMSKRCHDRHTAMTINARRRESVAGAG